MLIFLIESVSDELKKISYETHNSRPSSIFKKMHQGKVYTKYQETCWKHHTRNSTRLHWKQKNYYLPEFMSYMWL